MACDVKELLKIVFSGLLPLIIEAIDDGPTIGLRTRTPDQPSPCPVCGTPSVKVHAYHQRTLTDTPVDGKNVHVTVRIRRLVCSTRGCPRQTFREQLPGVLVRYQRRTPRLATQIGAVARELAGRAGARLLKALAAPVSKNTALRTLMRLPLPRHPVPRVLGVDDFALRKGRRYATVLTDTTTNARIEVLPDRTADTLETWLRDRPGIEVVVRDGFAAYAEAVRRALPDAVQVADRWHLWHNLSEAVRKDVASHSTCWAKAGPPLQKLDRQESTLERWHHIHDLLDQGVGLMECARRLNLSLNTIKRYARIGEPDRLRQAPQYRAGLVDPYRDYLRKRKEENPAVPVQRLFGEISRLGYEGSLNLLYKYINQGRLDSDREAISPKAFSALLLAHPNRLTPEESQTLAELTGACPEMARLGDHISGFAQLLAPAPGNAEALTGWIAGVGEDDLPHLHAFTRGLDQDRAAVDAALTLPFHNGGTEGVNTRSKLLKRQMYGRAGFP
ncbi:ISL3 family transposase, partial [Nocardiopsis exhalans]